MDIETAKGVLKRTHTASLRAGHRASGYHLESGPGVGKSDGVRQACAELAIELQQPVGLVVMMLASISSVDVRGFMIPVKADGKRVPDTVFSTPPWYPTPANTTVFYPDGSVAEPGTWTGEVPAIGKVFLDEFSQAEDDVKKPAAELVYKGQVGDYALPVGWRVVSAGNRMTDRSGVMRELMFIVNRRALLKIDASMPAFLNHWSSRPVDQQPHYLTLSFARKNPDIVFKDAVPEGHDPFCTPRTLCLLDKDLRALRTAEDIARNRLPTDPVAREVAAGWIGGGSAGQFFTHIKYADEIPEIDVIERDPMAAKLPPNKDAQLVCAFMMAHNFTAKNAGKLMDYLGRMHIDMQVLTVSTIAQDRQRGAELMSTPKMTAWLAKHRALLAASRA